MILVLRTRCRECLFGLIYSLSTFMRTWKPGFDFNSSLYSLSTFMQTWDSTFDFSIGVFAMLTLSILPFDRFGRLVHSQTYFRILRLTTSASYETVPSRSRTCRHVLGFPGTHPLVLSRSRTCLHVLGFPGTSRHPQSTYIHWFKNKKTQ